MIFLSTVMDEKETNNSVEHYEALSVARSFSVMSISRASSFLQ